MFRNTFLTGFSGYAITKDVGGDKNGHGNETGARAQAPEERRTRDRALAGVRKRWQINRSRWRPSEFWQVEQRRPPYGRWPGFGRLPFSQEVCGSGKK